MSLKESHLQSSQTEYKIIQPEQNNDSILSSLSGSPQFPGLKLNNGDSSSKLHFERIQAVLDKELDRELLQARQDLEDITEEIQNVRFSLLKVRHASVTEYYHRGTKTKLQRPLHPAVKSLLKGKSPKLSQTSYITSEDKSAGDQQWSNGDCGSPWPWRQQPECSNLSQSGPNLVDWNKPGPSGLGQVNRQASSDEEVNVTDFEEEVPSTNQETSSSSINVSDINEEYKGKTSPQEESQLSICSGSKTQNELRRLPRYRPPKAGPSSGVVLPESRGCQTKQQIRLTVGNCSKWVGDEVPGGPTHKWTVYIRSPDLVDLSRIISKIKFFLHPSYKPNDVIQISGTPFRLSRRGWGEFPIRVQLQFFHPSDKPLDILHQLKLDTSFSGIETFGGETVVEAWLHTDTDELTAPVKEREVDAMVKDEPSSPLAWLDPTDSLIDDFLAGSNADVPFYEEGKFSLWDGKLFGDWVEEEVKDCEVLPDKVGVTSQDRPVPRPVDSSGPGTSSSVPSSSEIKGCSSVVADAGTKLISPVKPATKPELVPNCGSSVPETDTAELSITKNVTEPILKKDPEVRVVRKLAHWKRRIGLKKLNCLTSNKSSSPPTLKDSSNSSTSIEQLKEDTVSFSTENSVVPHHYFHDHCYTPLMVEPPSNVEPPSIVEPPSNVEPPSIVDPPSDVEPPPDRTSELPASASHPDLIDWIKCPRGSEEQAVSWLVKKLPLVNPLARSPRYKSRHPYCAPTVQAFFDWPVGKQRGMEWTRATRVGQIMAKVFPDRPPWKTIDIVRWARFRGFTPFKPDPRAQAEEELKVIDMFTAPPDLTDLITLSRSMDSAEEVDIISVHSPPTPVEAEEESDEEVEREVASEGLAGWVEGAVSHRLGPGTSHLLTSVFSSMAEDLTRRALNHSWTRHSFRCPPAVEEIDVTGALLSREEFDLFTNAGLGAPSDVPVSSQLAADAGAKQTS